MYYNKITRFWSVDPLDCLILSAILGSILASYLKNYLSEDKSLERLKNSMIEKSGLVIKSSKPASIRNSKEIRIRRIYKFALTQRSGQIENFQANHKLSNEIFKLAQKIKNAVERLASFLKKRELRGVAKIFFKNGRLILELVLYRCRIDITYAVLNEAMTPQVIIITSTVGGIVGFSISWLSAGASLLTPPLLLTIFLLRSVKQSIVNRRDYLKFETLVNEMLDDGELKQTVRAFFMEGEFQTTNKIEMKPWDSNKNPLPTTLNLNSDQTFEEFVKARLKEELGLIENSIPEQLEIIHEKKIRNRAKTVYFKDLIKEIGENANNENIIDAEIINESIKVKLKNGEV